jgi:ATP-binding protein involved in chromosome partitioning
LGVPLLGSIPLQPGLTDLADAGRPIVDAEPESPAAAALRGVAEELQRKTAGRTMALPILRG